MLHQRTVEKSKVIHQLDVQKKSPYGVLQLNGSIWADTYITHTVCAHMHFKVFNQSRLPTHSCRHLCCLVPPPPPSVRQLMTFSAHTYKIQSHLMLWHFISTPMSVASCPVRHKGKIKQITTSPVESARPIRFFLTFCVFDIWIEKWLYQIGIFFSTLSHKNTTSQAFRLLLRPRFGLFDK